MFHALAFMVFWGWTELVRIGGVLVDWNKGAGLGGMLYAVAFFGGHRSYGVGAKGIQHRIYTLGLLHGLVRRFVLVLMISILVYCHDHIITAR